MSLGGPACIPARGPRGTGRGRTWPGTEIGRERMSGRCRAARVGPASVGSDVGTAGQTARAPRSGADYRADSACRGWNRRGRGTCRPRRRRWRYGCEYDVTQAPMRYVHDALFDGVLSRAGTYHRFETQPRRSARARRFAQIRTRFVDPNHAFRAAYQRPDTGYGPVSPYCPRSLPAQGFRSPPRVILSAQNAFSCARPLVRCSSPEPV